MFAAVHPSPAGRSQSAGHWQKNLRVIDDRTGDNIGFVKAFVRFIIKSLLGIFSSIAMLVTRRRQSFHDVVTGTTVQIRDLAIADRHHYHEADPEIGRPGMPSAFRRVLVISEYMLLSFVVLQFISAMLIKSDLISVTCIHTTSRCSLAEHGMLTTLGIGLVAIWLVLIAKGWRGKLLGARAKSAS